MDCIFCKIVNGEIPSMTLYEDDIVKVFMDINPSTNGDCLVILKRHFETMLDITDEELLHIHKVSKEIYKMLKEKLNIDGLTLAQNNFYGQDVKHYHVHLTPRYKNDNLTHSFNKDLLEDVKDIYNKIKTD